MKTNCLNLTQMQLVNGGQTTGSMRDGVHYTGDPRTNIAVYQYAPCYWGGCVLSMGAAEGMASAMG